MVSLVLLVIVHTARMVCRHTHYSGKAQECCRREKVLSLPGPKLRPSLPSELILSLYSMNLMTSAGKKDFVSVIEEGKAASYEQTEGSVLRVQKETS